MPTHLSRNVTSMLPTLGRSATKTMIKNRKHKKKIQVMSKCLSRKQSNVMSATIDPKIIRLTKKAHHVSSDMSRTDQSSGSKLSSNTLKFLQQEVISKRRSSSRNKSVNLGRLGPNPSFQSSMISTLAGGKKKRKMSVREHTEQKLKLSQINPKRVDVLNQYYFKRKEGYYKYEKVMNAFKRKILEMALKIYFKHFKRGPKSSRFKLVIPSRSESQKKLITRELKGVDKILADQRNACKDIRISQFKKDKRGKHLSEISLSSSTSVEKGKYSTPLAKDSLLPKLNSSKRGEDNKKSNLSLCTAFMNKLGRNRRNLSQIQSLQQTFERKIYTDCIQKSKKKKHSKKYSDFFSRPKMQVGAKFNSGIIRGQRRAACTSLSKVIDTTLKLSARKGVRKSFQIKE